MARLRALVGWLPVAYLVHDAIVEVRYDTAQHSLVVIDKFSKHFIDINRCNGDVEYLDPNSAKKRLGRVVGLGRDWVTVNNAITRVPKGSIAIEDAEGGRRRIIPEALVEGQLRAKFRCG
jgi:hypothetical protein